MKDTQSNNVVRESVREGIVIEGIAKVAVIARHFVLFPVFIAAWGTAIYGEWLALTSYAAMVGIAQFGIGTACTNEMVASIEKNDPNRAILIFWAGALPVWMISLLIAMIGALLFLIDWDVGILISSLKMPPIEGRTVLASAIIQSGGLIFSSIPIGALFACKGFKFMRIWTLVSQLVAMGATLIVLLSGASPTFLAVFLCGLTWFIGCLAMGTLIRVAPGIRIWPERFKERFREAWAVLLAPSFAFFLSPCIRLLLFQVPTIMLGSCLGGTYVTGFSACRTLTNGLLQGVTLVTAPTWRSLTAAVASQNRQRIDTLNRNLLVYVCLLVGGGGSVLLVAGDYIFRLWLGREFAYDPWIFRGLLFCVSLSAFSGIFGLLPSATNQNLRMSLQSLIWSAVIMGLTWISLVRSEIAIQVVIGLAIARLGQLVFSWQAWMKVKKRFGT